MPAPLRYLLYLVLGIGALIGGRYLFPGAKQFTNSAITKQWEASALSQVWKKKTASILNSPASDQDKLARGSELLDRMAPEDFPFVLDELHDDPILGPFLTAAWAETDTAGCFKYFASKHQRSASSGRLIGIFVSIWARKDFPAAEAAASRLRIPGQHPDPLLATAVTLLRSDIPKGIDYMTKRNLSMPATAMVAELQPNNPTAPHWKGMDTNARIDFLQSLPPSNWREFSLEKLYATWMAQEPRVILTECQQTGRGLSLVNTATQKWISTDPDAAAAFFEKDSRHQVKAILGTSLARYFARTDPQIAWDFVESSLTGAARSQMKMEIVNTLLSTDPAAAWQWIKDLPDAPWRTQILLSLEKIWSQTDSPDSTEWRKELSATDRAALILAKLTPARHD